MAEPVALSKLREPKDITFAQFRIGTEGQVQIEITLVKEDTGSLFRSNWIDASEILMIERVKGKD